MKNLIALSLMCVLSAGCLQDYPETGDNGQDKACNLANSNVAYQSTIAFQYNDSDIPEKLSASVNGMAVVNECTLGTDNSSYLTVRNGNSVTILFRVGGNAAMTEMFFNDDGTPKSNVQFQMILRGRDSCSDSPAQIYSTTRSLEWKPVYSNSNKECAATGYSATASN